MCISNKKFFFLIPSNLFYSVHNIFVFSILAYIVILIPGMQAQNFFDGCPTKAVWKPLALGTFNLWFYF